MTGDYSEQLRAIFLAFVMVTSIAMAGVAFSGSAAAESATVSESGGSTADLDNAYNDDINTGDGEADTLTISEDLDDNGQLVIDGSSDLTITNADGTSPTIDLSDASSDAIQINSDVDVTIEGVKIIAPDDNNAINANGISGDTQLSVRDSTINVSDAGGGDAFAIRTNDATAGNAGVIDVQNTTFGLKTDDANTAETAIRAYKSTEVSVTDSTFDAVSVGVQASDVPDVTVSGSTFTDIEFQGVLLNNENDDEYSPNVDISGNDFESLGAPSVLLLEDTPAAGGSTGDNFAAGTNGIDITNNNFNDSDTYAIATSTGVANVAPGSGSSGDEADLTVTINAENNYFGSDLGPVVETAQSDADERDIPTEYQNDGDAAFLLNASDVDYRPFRVGPAPDGASADFDLDNSISQPDGPNTRTEVNVTFAGNVNESSIEVYAINEGTNGNNETLVENGEIVADDSTVVQSTLDGSNDAYEFVSINSSVQEGSDVEVEARAKDTSGNDIFTSTQQEVAASGIDMAGESLKVITDSNNPQSGNNAKVAVVAVDKFDNELTDDQDTDDTAKDVNAEPDEISLSFDDSANATVNDPDGEGTTGPFDDSDAPTLVNSTGSYTTLSKVSYSEVGDLDITAIDTGSDLTLNSDTATQTYTAAVDGIDVSINETSLPADSSTTTTITAQLVDANGNAVERGGETVTLSQTNNTAAGLTVEAERGSSGSATGAGTDRQVETFNNGTAEYDVSATDDGFDITATVSSSSLSVSGSSTYQTVAGDVSDADSTLSVGGQDQSGTLTNVEVASDQRVFIELLDSQSNSVSNYDVTLSSNVSGTSFESTTLTTNSSGQAETTATLPEQAGDFYINASAGSFNESSSTAASVQVTSNAANVSTLAFASDAPASIAPNSENNGVNIEANDMFGNLNETDSGTVTLESSDASVVDFDGAASSDQAFSGGVANFNVDANGTGTATLTATIPDENVTNVSQDITVANPDGIQLTPAHNVVSSDVSQGANQAELEAQFVDADGDALGINNENITFARQSGSAAELDQSRTDFTEKTDGDGNVTINVNGTSSTGETTFIALSENFSVQGSTTVTTTGGADSISVSPENSSVAVNETVNVTASFVDTEGRNVPRVGTGIQLSTGGNGTVDDGSVSTALVDGDVIAEFTYNATDATAGEDATLTALGDGVTGTATISVTGDAGAPGEFDPVTEYGNEQGEVDTDGLLGGIGDYRTGDLTVEQLLEVIGEWRASR